MKMHRAAYPITLVVLLALGGCSTTTRIQTVPTGALVYINDEPIGYTPLKADIEWWGNEAKLHYKIEKSGYKTIEGHLKKQLYKGHIAVDVLCLAIPLLWFNAAGPLEQYDFALPPLDATPESAGSSLPQSR